MHQKNALDPEALLDPFADLESNADEVKTSAVSEAALNNPLQRPILKGAKRAVKAVRAILTTISKSRPGPGAEVKSTIWSRMHRVF
jgi:hypothetical protein